MGKWPMGQRIVGVDDTAFLTKMKWSGRLGLGWVWWVCWWVCVGDGDGWVVSGSVDSGCHELSENVWFVWSKASYSGDKWRCYRCGTGRTYGQVNIGLLSFWSVRSWVSQYWDDNAVYIGEEGGGGHRVEPGDTDRSISLERGGGGCQDAKDQQSPQDDRGSGFLIFSFC